MPPGKSEHHGGSVTTNCEQTSCELLRFYTRHLFHTLSGSGTSRKKWNFQKCTFLWKLSGSYLEVIWKLSGSYLFATSMPLPYHFLMDG
jgi:hypothetical protein